jgi:hypothetical protein
MCKRITRCANKQPFDINMSEMGVRKSWHNFTLRYPPCKSPRNIIDCYILCRLLIPPCTTYTYSSSIFTWDWRRESDDLKKCKNAKPNLSENSKTALPDQGKRSLEPPSSYDITSQVAGLAFIGWIDNIYISDCPYSHFSSVPARIQKDLRTVTKAWLVLRFF